MQQMLVQLGLILAHRSNPAVVNSNFFLLSTSSSSAPHSRQPSLTALPEFPQIETLLLALAGLCLSKLLSLALKASGLMASLPFCPCVYMSF